MSSRDRLRRPRFPCTHYFLSVSRGDSIRTAAIRPAALWTILALAPLSFCFGVAGLADLGFHDDIMSAIVRRQGQVERIYEKKLAEARAKLEEATRRRLSDQASVEMKLHRLLDRQDELERRATAVAALAAGAAPALSHSTMQGGVAPKCSLSGAVPERSPAWFQDRSAAGTAPEPKNRLDLVQRSLDRLEVAQTETVAAVDASARRALACGASILSATGIDPAKLGGSGPGARLGGPFAPLEPDSKDRPFDLAALQAASDVTAARRMEALMSSIPLREPLSGGASISSPFGYRTDPFLGRPALHTGVDLLQDYGAEVRATAAGRVTVAGPLGGYGAAVEIDHGHGLSTRYGHLSEIVVAEGQDVAPGALLGRLGSTGRSTGPHLHYEVRVDGEPVDPERFLRAGAQLSAE